MVYVYEKESNGIPLVQQMDTLAAQGDQESPFGEVLIRPTSKFVVNSLNNSAVELVRNTCQIFYGVDELVKYDMQSVMSDHI